MATPVKMPQLGESVVEGTVLRWLKQPGEAVARHEALLEISTDKIDTEVPAPVDGVLLEIFVHAGTTVTAGTPIAIIGTLGAVAGERPASPQPATSYPSATPAGQQATSSIAASEVRPAGRTFVSPVVARMSAEHGIDLAQVTGTGLGGRITKKDLEAHLSEVARELPKGQQESRMEGEVLRLEEEDVLQPLTTMRRAIAQHMVHSKHTSPHVTSICEVDMTAVVRHREENKRTYTRNGAPLTYTAYLLAAIVEGLRAVPEANSRFTDAGIVLRRQIHVGVAVSLPDGLLVPVIRNADELSLAGLARALNELVTRARGGQLKPDELQGGTFTLTNHGTGGSLLATPIIHQPQSGILGAGAIVKRPVVRSSSASLLPSADDAIVVRPMCYLSFAFDHRVMDGAQADRFLMAVRKKLETWKE